MIEPYLLLQADYEGIVVALCSNGKVIASEIIPKMDACKCLMIGVNRILALHELNFSDLIFLAINQGPAPFTTLRVVITTANALNFAHKLPLIGIDALQAFGGQFIHLQKPVIALLNAFSQDVYFSIVDNGMIETGWGKYDVVIDTLACRFKNQAIVLVGNGVDLHKTLLVERVAQPEFLTPNPVYVDVAYVAQCAYEQWQANYEGVALLEPLYIKTQEYKASM